MNEEYLVELYDYLGTNDATFQGDVSKDQFIADMADKQYAAQIYQYLGSLDESFKFEVDITTFLGDIGITTQEEEVVDLDPLNPEVKKKDDTVSPSEIGSSDSSETEVGIITNWDDFKINYDPDQIIPKDTRDDDYRDPIRALGMYPEGGEDAYTRAYAQQRADIEYTSKKIQEENPELLATQAKEKATRKGKGEDTIASNEMAQVDEGFQQALNATDAAKINLQEEDAVPYFNSIYGKYGFNFREISIGDAMEGSIVLPNGDVKKIEIDLDPFFDSTAAEESEKLKNFVKQYAQNPDENREQAESDFVTSAIKAQHLRDTPRLNNDGTESTVLFESGEVDGKFVVYPTLFPINPEISNADPRYWNELDGMDAYEEALKRNEVFIFKTDKEAKEFAKGSWKDVRNIDAEGQRFFQDRGYDYLNIKNQYEAYENARERFYHLQDEIKWGARNYDSLTEEEQEMFGDFYNSKGYLRQDAEELLKIEEDKFNALKDVYLDDDLQEVQEDFDVYIDKQYQKLSRNAARSNASAKYVSNELEAKSLAEFGLTIDELKDYNATDDDGKEMQDAILTSYKATKDVSSLAANEYEVAQTYLSGKFDENLRGELVDNWGGFMQQVDEGWYRGKAGNEILKMALGLEGDDDESTAELAQRIVDYLDASNTEETSRAMGRWHRAKGFREAWDAFSDNPAELMFSMAANSINQMLPYGTKIIAATTATGTGIGAGIGATGFVTGPGGVVTTGGGAAAGAIWGLRTGFAATSYALEYTNAILDVARKEGYNINDPEDMTAALNDPLVWKKGNVRGAQRGIPIAVVDMLSSGLAGRVFNAGKTASFGRRVAVQLGERVVFDPFAEATGELAAQISAGDKIEMKEIFAEAMGGLGNNAPFAALNTALDLRAQNNTTIANDISSIRGLNNELKGFFAPSPTKVSSWANNMHKLGQISTETNQRIQVNLGLRQDAQNVLNATEGKSSPEVLNRTMELMAAKQELESSSNRREVFSGKLKEIKAELNELVETKTVRPNIESATDTQIEQGNTFGQGFQTNLAGIVGLNENQTSGVDIRTDAKSKYTIDGKSLKRSKFLSRIMDMSPKELKAANITIDNDEKVSELVTDKFGQDAISKQETGTVDENQQTGNMETMEESLRGVQEQTTESTTTQESEVETPQVVGNNPLSSIEVNEDTGKQRREKTKAITQALNNGDITNEEAVELREESFANMNEAARIFKENKQRKAAEVSVDTESETIVVPKSLKQPTIADVQAYDNKTIDQSRLDRILAGIADKQIANQKLSEFQKRVVKTRANQLRVDEMVSSKTQAESVAEMEAMLEGETVVESTTELTPAEKKAKIEAAIKKQPKKLKWKKQRAGVYVATTPLYKFTIENRGKINEVGEAVNPDGRWSVTMEVTEDFDDTGFDSPVRGLEEAYIIEYFPTKKQAEKNAEHLYQDYKTPPKFQEDVATEDVATEEVTPTQEVTTEEVTTEEVTPPVEVSTKKGKRAATKEEAETEEGFGDEYTFSTPVTPAEIKADAKAELDGEIEDINVEIENTKQQLKKDLAKKGLTSAEKADLRQDAKAEIDNYKEDIKELKREYKAEVARVNKINKQKNKTIQKELNKIDAEIEEIKKSKRNRATKVALIEELRNKRTRIEDGNVQFKQEGKFVPNTDEVAQITEAINELASGNVETNLDETVSESTIDVNDINQRTDSDINSIGSLEIINGVPVIFTISDQLTTGNVVNPQTNTTIDNLKGGIGFTGTEGNQNLAWANTTDTEASNIIEKATAVYEANKPTFEEFWAANPEYNGLVPMPVVKMGEGSILSNEATFRVFRDNLSKIPEVNRKKALEALVGAINKKIATKQAAIDSGKKSPLTNKNYAKEIAGLKNVIELINEQQPETLDDVVSVEFLQKLNLPTRTEFLKTFTFGEPNKPGTKKTATKGQKLIPNILIEGMEKDAFKLVHLAEITDILTEPQLANVPNRSIVALQGVDVLNPEVLESTHPNYPFGVKGKSIGILENPVSLVKAFPQAYQNAMGGLVKSEAKGKKVTQKQRERASVEDRKTMPEAGELAPSSVGSILTETLGVQIGMPNLEFVGAISQGNVDNATKLTAFMNLSFPQTNITTDKATFETVMSQDNVMKYKKGGQTVYGVTVDGDIYINPDVHNSTSALHNTSIHEMGHVWTDYLKTTKKGRTIYAKGVTLVEQTEEYQRQLKKFDGDKARAANETMAILIGNKGQTIADASIKSKFKEWLLGMWNYIKSQFKQTQDLSAEEIQALTLDEFIGSALADIFAGKKLPMTDSQLKKMKNPEVAFSTDLSITDVVKKGRENGFSDATIREVLKGRGFKKADIDTALTYKVDVFGEMPSEFQRVEGGIQVAAQMFNDIKIALEKFATSGRANIIGKKRVKTFSEIRQKAQELIQAHPTYKQQTDTVQMELRVGLDRSLGYRGNKNVSQQISQLKKTLKDRTIGAQNLQELKTQLKNYIRTVLPKSQDYTQAQINRFINAVNDIKTPEQMQRQMEKVMRLVDEQRAKMKRSIIREIISTAKKKSSTRKQSGKRRPKGLDNVGVLFFENAKQILKALSLTDPEARAIAIQEVKTDLEARQDELAAAYELMMNDQELTAEQENLVQKQAAFDMFADLETASLEEAQQVLNDMKGVAKESILRMNNRRLQEQADAASLKEELDTQIQETNPDLFNEDGTLKGEAQRTADKEQIRQNFIKRGIRNVVDKITDALFGRTNSALSSFKNSLTNLQTVTNFLDNKNRKLTLFTDKVYRKLTRTREVSLQNIRTMKQTLNDFATESGIENGFLGVERKLNSLLGFNYRGIINTKTFNLKENVVRKGKRQVNEYKTELNANQMLRLYALYKNDVQRKKLINQGITPEVMAEIEATLGPELLSFADKMVNYLSTDYFNEVNSVYKQANGVSLGFVENYFPTKIIKPKVDGNMLVDGDFSKIFNAETAPAFKDRTDFGSDIDLKGGTFTGVLMNHMETMETYKAYAMPVKEINNFFKVESVNVLLEETGMAGLTRMLVNAAVNPRAAAQASMMSKTKAGRVGRDILSKFQSFFTSWALGLKLVQIPKQATSFVNAYSKYNYFPKNSNIPSVVQSAVDAVMFPVDLVGVLLDIGKGLLGKKGAIAKMREKSALFDQRIREGLEGDIYGLESGSQTYKEAGQGTSYLARIRRKVKQIAAAPTILGDILGVMGYYINYKRNIANGMTEAEALEAFNAYESTQQTRSNTEKVPLQLQGDFQSRVFTMFGSTLFLQMNNVMQNATNMRRAFRDAIDKKESFFGKKGIQKEDIRSFYLNAAVANALFVGVSNLALLTRGDKDDQDLFYKKVGEALMGMNLLYQIPLFGAYIEELNAKWMYDKPRKVDDVVNPIKSIDRKVTKLMESDNAFEKYVQPIAEIVLKTQLDPMVALYNAIQDGTFGDVSEKEFYENIYELLGVTPSYRPGHGRRGPNLEGVIPEGGIRTKTQLKRYDPELYEKIYGRRDAIEKEKREIRKEALRKRGYVERNGKLYKID